MMAGDWLQGPYFYEVYSSKVFGGKPASLELVSRLFLAGFGATALLGPYVGRLADARGRKRGTLAYAALYAGAAFTTKSPLLWVLFAGRLLSGVGPARPDGRRGRRTAAGAGAPPPVLPQTSPAA